MSTVLTPARAVRYAVAPSPLGDLVLTGDGDALTSLYFVDGGRGDHRPRPEWVLDEAPFRQVKAELAAYFAGDSQVFTVPVSPYGTAFQQRVWERLRTIPFGVTTTYGALAKALGDANAMRAVGLANGRNPISIIIPCHRVIGVDGTLTGYGGGLHRKRWLLAHEGLLTLPLPPGGE